MQNKYMQPRGVRRVARTLAGTFRGGKLTPISSLAIRESESATVQQSVTFELDPIAGRMISEMKAYTVAVFVPVQSIDVLKNPDADYAGVTEVVREKLLSGNPLFGLENEAEITERMGVVPRSVNGAKKVNEAARLAHNCAVNHLRQRKYVKAETVDKDNFNVTPALIGQTVLDRLNGVLDPEDRVNGAVQFDGKLNVEGIGVGGWTTPSTINDRKFTGETVSRQVEGWQSTDSLTDQRITVEEDANNPGFPGVFADLAGSTAISLIDFYQAEMQDKLTREMRGFVDANPQYGEEIVVRWAHGVSVDVGKHPWVVYESEEPFQSYLEKAMDGPSQEQQQRQSNLVYRKNFSVVIPKTELGGILITFAALKPDETLASQPDPILSDNWGARNFVADELAIDPVPVTIRELNADCNPANEGTIAFYTGNNELLRNYVNYGFNRYLDPATVENKTAIWQLEVPMSVIPQSVIYPEDLDHYPFNDQQAEVCTYPCPNRHGAQSPLTGALNSANGVG